MKDNSTSRTSLNGFFKENEQYYSSYMRQKLSNSPEPRHMSSQSQSQSRMRGNRSISQSQKNIDSFENPVQYTSLRDNSRNRLKSGSLNGPISITNISVNKDSTSNFMKNCGEQTLQQFEVQRLSDIEKNRQSRLSGQAIEPFIDY